VSKRRDEGPKFRGYDEDGEPIFVWEPDVPGWMRDEYVEEWKRTHTPPTKGAP
jgi:hypothetical protein